MRLTTKGRFAVTAMIDVAINSGHGPATLAGVSERQGISLSYLEQLFGKLRRRGLVLSVRGPGGGYRLGMDPGRLTVADIVLAVDDDAVDVMPDEMPRKGAGHAVTDRLWDRLNDRLFEFLQSVSLAELVSEQQGSAVFSMPEPRTGGGDRGSKAAAA